VETNSNYNLDLNEGAEKLVLGLLGLLALTAFIGALFAWGKLKKNHYYPDRFGGADYRKELGFSFLAMIILGGGFVVLGKTINPYFFLGTWGVYGYFTYVCSFFLLPKLMPKQFDRRLDARYLNRKFKNISELEKSLPDPDRSPMGMSLTTKKPIFIENYLRNEHVLITGSTGSRKSSAAITLKRSDYFHDRPVIDLDPKGDKEDYECMKKFAKLYDREQDFLHFDISDPQNSWGYDPLEIGSKRAKVDKILFALDLNHEHYAGLAEDMISLLFDVADFTDYELNIDKLSKLLISKELREEMFEVVFNSENSENSEARDNLTMRIKNAGNLKGDDLKGIKSKLSALGTLDLKPILSPSSEKKINLVDVIKNKKIAYFQLNDLEFEKFSRVIGRFILRDLGIIASDLASGKISLGKKEFVPVYIDEALSLIDETFPKYLRMVRSSNIGVTVILQTLSNLDRQFGPAFKNEIINDMKCSLHFETGSSDDIESISLIPGTIKTFQDSKMVDKNTPFAFLGKGTRQNIEVKLVESNVIRGHKKGQCLFFDRSRKVYDLMESWSAKDPNANPKSAIELWKDYHDGDKKSQKQFSYQDLVGQKPVNVLT